MKKYQIDSSNIETIGYDVQEKKLVVTFKNGGSYQYDGVGPSQVCGLLFAESVGKVFHDTIKNREFIRLGTHE